MRAAGTRERFILATCTLPIHPSRRRGALYPGGLNFGPLISELIETDIAPHVTEQDDFYLVHRDSVVGPEAARATFDDISALLREQSDSPATSLMFQARVAGSCHTRSWLI